MTLIVIKRNTAYIGFKFAAFTSYTVSVMSIAHWEFMPSCKFLVKVYNDLPDDKTSYVVWQ